MPGTRTPENVQHILTRRRSFKIQSYEKKNISETTCIYIFSHQHGCNRNWTPFFSWCSKHEI